MIRSANIGTESLGVRLPPFFIFDVIPNIIFAIICPKGEI